MNLFVAVTSPVYGYTGAISESIWVQVPDANGCGVAMDIIRSRELGDVKIPVPVIMVPSSTDTCYRAQWRPDRRI